MNQKNIRNFCIIAHIDHGKSTLADRLLETTGAITKRELKDRMMDTLDLEQERGITIKLQTARLSWDYQGRNDFIEDADSRKLKAESYFPNTQHLPSNTYTLNLIDTPGHVDFSYEVSRSVAASEGALLVVDASQGIQAQTLTTIYKAMEYDLTIIPVLNKVDLPNANVERVKAEMIETFGFDEDEIILASGKTGIGAEEILNAIVERIPAPDKENTMIYLPTLDSKSEDDAKATKALIFDAFYHEYKGVVALVKVVSGEISKNDDLYAIQTEKEISPIEIGYLTPKMMPNEKISEGEVGYIATGLKSIQEVHTGDTLTIHNPKTNDEITSLMGYQAPTPMVYASLYPVDSSDYKEFADALEKLALNDASLTYQREFSQALGSGFVCGFLGLLHLEITQQRLEDEFDIDLISTTPTVEFKLKLSTTDYGKIPMIKTSNIDQETNIATVRTATEFPDGSLYEYVEEPWVKLEIITPDEYVGDVMELTQMHRGEYQNMTYVNKNATSDLHAIISYHVPTLEVITSYFDKLKSVTHGYASMDYEFLEYKKSDIVKVSVLLNNEEVEPLSFLSHRINADRKAKSLAKKLLDVLPKQQFKIPIQCAIGGNVIARETIQALRKDVTAKLYGGDETRKKKLLEKQKKGKARMKMFGSVEVPKEAFLAVLKDHD